MFYSELTLAISPESIRQYTELAYQHLHENNSTVGVARVGVDEEGNDIFGIRLTSDDGQEEWYDPYESDARIGLGWTKEEDAAFELSNRVLPQIGYSVFQKKLQLFHINMGEI